MNYYENKYTGRIFNDNAIKFAREVYGDQVDQDIECGYLKKLEKEPDVVVLLKKASFATAVTRYMEIHNCDYGTALKGVRSIVDLMHRKKKAKKPDTPAE